MPELAPDLRVSFEGGLLDLWRLASAVDIASIGVGVLPLELLAGAGMVLCIPHVLHMWCVYTYVYVYICITLPLVLPCTVLS